MISGKKGHSILEKHTLFFICDETFFLGKDIQKLNAFTENKGTI